MSFFGRKPQPSSAEKIAAAETEIEMVSNMFNQYVISFYPVLHSHRVSEMLTYDIGW